MGDGRRSAGRRRPADLPRRRRTDGKVMAFDKLTGEEIWRALSSDWEPGYRPPTIIEAAGVRQLIIFHPRAINALDPATGKVYWDGPARGRDGHDHTHAGAKRPLSLLHVAVRRRAHAQARSDQARRDAAVERPRRQRPRIEPDTLNSVISTPVIEGDYVYGVDGTGSCAAWSQDRQAGVGDAALLGASPNWHGVLRPQWRPLLHQHRSRRADDRHALPKGYEEIGRTKLIEPTHPHVRRREVDVRAVVARRPTPTAHRHSQRQRDRAPFPRQGLLTCDARSRRCSWRWRGGPGARCGADAAASGPTGGAPYRRARRPAHGHRARRVRGVAPREDFRWAEDLAAFLKVIDAQGAAGPTWSLMATRSSSCSTPRRGACTTTRVSVHRGRSARTVWARARRARPGDDGAWGLCSPGSNRVVFVPGDHDAALLFPAVARRLVESFALPGPKSRRRAPGSR